MLFQKLLAKKEGSDYMVGHHLFRWPSEVLGQRSQSLPIPDLLMRTQSSDLCGSRKLQIRCFPITPLYLLTAPTSTSSFLRPASEQQLATAYCTGGNDVPRGGTSFVFDF